MIQPTRMRLSLKALRVNAGMTQQDVADRLNVSRETVGKWENGNIHNLELVIHALAKLYDVEFDNMKIPS